MIRKNWTKCEYCDMVGPIERYRDHLKNDHDLSDETIGEIMLKLEQEMFKKEIM